MILEHFGHSPMKPPRDFAQKLIRGDYDKPQGLWVSVRGEDDWLSWCTAEGFGVPDAFQIRTVVHLVPNANILLIQSVAELDAFDDRFGRQVPFGVDFEWRVPDWKAVADEYDGIVIAPYLWERRLDRKCRWYYGWDCASGCIWKARAIERLEVIDPPTFETQEEEAA